MGSVEMGEYSNSTENTLGSLSCNLGTDEDSENTTKSDSVADDKVNNVVGFVGSESDDEDNRMFFMSCAENKVNAFIERMKEYRENYGRPEEFENQAVSMAIQQHGLKKYEERNIQDVCFDCNSDLGLNSCNVINNLPATSKSRRIRKDSNDSLETHHDGEDEMRNETDESDGEPSRSKRKKHSNFDFRFNNSNNDCNNFDFDNVSFLNEAVAVAIEKKGLSSSTCCSLK